LIWIEAANATGSRERPRALNGVHIEAQQPGRGDACQTLAV